METGDSGGPVRIPRKNGFTPWSATIASPITVHKPLYSDEKSSLTGRATAVGEIIGVGETVSVAVSNGVIGLSVEASDGMNVAALVTTGGGRKGLVMRFHAMTPMATQARQRKPPMRMGRILFR